MLLLIPSRMPFGSILSLTKKNILLIRKKTNRRTKGRITSHLKGKIKKREKKCEV